MGYDPSSDNGAQQWRDVYWSFGQNLVDMMNKAEAEQRWDLLGVGHVLKAWGWQVLTDLHGEIIIKEALDQTRSASTTTRSSTRTPKSQQPARRGDQEPAAHRRRRRRGRTWAAATRSTTATAPSG